MKIVFTDYSTVVCNNDIDLSNFKDYGEVVFYENTSLEERIERIADADAVICSKTIIDAEVMKKCPNLKYVGLLATGYNNVDVKYAAQRGVCVCNAASYSTEAVAQHCFAMLLSIYSALAEYAELIKDGGWIRSKNFSAFGSGQTEISGKTIGIVGCGSIGRQMVRIANAFNMKVLACVRTPREIDGAEVVSLDELLSKSDVVSVHCPLTEETNKLFNEENFAKMKDGSIFINSSRGPVVDEPALRHALESGKLRAAAVDVLEYEPMRADCPLIGAPNLIITPHVAWAPLETRKRLMSIVEDNLKAWHDGVPQNVVSK